jgi:hypothetical protein
LYLTGVRIHFARINEYDVLRAGLNSLCNNGFNAVFGVEEIYVKRFTRNPFDEFFDNVAAYVIVSSKRMTNPNENYFTF